MAMDSVFVRVIMNTRWGESCEIRPHAHAEGPQNATVTSGDANPMYY